MSSPIGKTNCPKCGTLVVPSSLKRHQAGMKCFAGATRKDAESRGLVRTSLWGVPGTEYLATGYEAGGHNLPVPMSNGLTVKTKRKTKIVCERWAPAMAVHNAAEEICLRIRMVRPQDEWGLQDIRASMAELRQYRRNPPAPTAQYLRHVHGTILAVANLYPCAASLGRDATIEMTKRLGAKGLTRQRAWRNSCTNSPPHAPWGPLLVSTLPNEGDTVGEMWKARPEGPSIIPDWF